MTHELRSDAPPASDFVLDSLLSDRFSCRSFLPTPVPQQTMERMFEIAQKTASWCNTQPWQVVVTSGAATDEFRNAIYEAASTQEMKSDIPQPGEYQGVYKLRRQEAGYSLYNSAGIQRDDYGARRTQMLENYQFFGAPHTAVITTDRALGEYGYVDCGGYISTLLLAARSLGIDTIAQAAIAMYSDLVRDHFQLGDDRVVVAAVSFGYADRGAPINGFRTSRSELPDVVTWL